MQKNELRDIEAIGTALTPLADFVRSVYSHDDIHDCLLAQLCNHPLCLHIPAPA